jgi:enoyl-CoA hydratase/carnithine racemase
MTGARHLSVDRSGQGIWRITLDNPPINMLTPAAILELQALVTQVESDPHAKVMVLQSADPDFFMAHFDTAAADAPREPGPSGHASWIDVVVRLARSPVVSIAKIRGRTRGVGNEFVLACDMRFASRQRAIFGNPEIGVGLPPGGGALEWLPRLVGRSRALEILLSGDDFDADVAERYGWINRAIDDASLDAFVDALAARLVSFDRQTLGDVKAQVNRFGVPTGDELETSNRMFLAGLRQPAVQARFARLKGLDYGRRGDLEMNFGRYLPELRPV